MFFALLFVTFVLSVVVSFAVVKAFDQSLTLMFNRILQDSIGTVWKRYIVFASYVVGISGGVRIFQLERYISAPHKDTEVLTLNSERWTLEVYRTIIETLQSLAWMYLVVLIFTLIAYAIVRGFEFKHSKEHQENKK